MQSLVYSNQIGRYVGAVDVAIEQGASLETIKLLNKHFRVHGNHFTYYSIYLASCREDKELCSWVIKYFDNMYSDTTATQIALRDFTFVFNNIKSLTFLLEHFKEHINMKRLLNDSYNDHHVNMIEYILTNYSQDYELETVLEEIRFYKARCSLLTLYTPYLDKLISKKVITNNYEN